MYLTKSAVDKRYSKDNTIHQIKSVKNRNGKNFTFDEKVLLGVLVETDTAVNVTKEFNVSKQMLSSNKDGMTSEGGKRSLELTKKIDEIVRDRSEEIDEEVLDNLTLALGLVNEDLRGSKRRLARESVGVAKDLSTIHKNLQKKIDKDGNINNGVQIVIQAPAQIREENYEKISV